MKRDYFQFMEKLLKRGHAVQLTEAKKVRQQDRVGPEKKECLVFATLRSLSSKQTK